MKPGAGDDLLSDDSSDEDVQDDHSDDLRTDDVDDLLADDRDSETESTSNSESSSSGYTLPWIHRRDTVKSDRPEIIQMHVQQSTVDGEDDLQDAVEENLGEDVFALDLREAAYLVAMKHPDEVADQLREWGYDVE